MSLAALLAFFLGFDLFLDAILASLTFARALFWFLIRHHSKCLILLFSLTVLLQRRRITLLSLLLLLSLQFFLFSKVLLRSDDCIFTPHLLGHLASVLLHAHAPLIRNKLKSANDQHQVHEVVEVVAAKGNKSARCWVDFEEPEQGGHTEQVFEERVCETSRCQEEKQSENERRKLHNHCKFVLISHHEEANLSGVGESEAHVLPGISQHLVGAVCHL